ncbi:hypothetical protein [Amphibacillus marinus]|nr:hypothetical protein [Amphibacillus marinus]
MDKWGLFMVSIGCLLLLFSANARTGNYDYLSLVTAIFLIVVGSVLAFKYKQPKKMKD